MAFFFDSLKNSLPLQAGITPLEADARIVFLP